MDIALQSSDTVFVPFTGPQVTARGAFMRLKGMAPVTPAKGLNNVEDQDAVTERKEGQEEEAEMSVEILPNEHVSDLVHFMGGIQPNAFSTFLTIYRRDPNGLMNAINLPSDEPTLNQTVLYPEDQVMALLKNLRTQNVVEITGNVRVKGRFEFTPGMRVGDLLNNLDEVLPDTYLARGHILRTLPDESKELLTFDVEKALQGDSSQNPPLNGRDRIELFNVERLRLKETVAILGAVTKPGEKPWSKGMRASDLLFLGGIPLNSANRFVAEIAHIRQGKILPVTRLDLSKLLSTEQASPVALLDDSENPVLEPFDQLSVFSLPDYKVHSTVTLRGQVSRPGTYELDKPHMTLKEIIERAGGLTEESMPRAGIVFRRLGATEKPVEKVPGKIPENIGEGEQFDQRVGSITEILSRLNEVKRQQVTGQLLRTPLLHELTSGALSRVVVDFQAMLTGDPNAQLELENGDEIFIPRRTDVAYVMGEAASPFAVYKIGGGETVKDLISKAGGLTRNADSGKIRLLKVDGRIIDHWVMSKGVEPGDAVLIPQLVRRDTTWQDNLNALTPLALILNAINH
jgi:protein involved in polysaccharide export with SLBB domain